MSDAHKALLGFDEALAAGWREPLAVERCPSTKPTAGVGRGSIAPYPLPQFDYARWTAMPSPPRISRRLWRRAAGRRREARPAASAPRSCTLGVPHLSGAPLPAGADAVVMQEHVEPYERDGARWARIPGAVRAGANIRRRGEDLAAGSVAIARGTRLDPGKIALAAALDRGTLPVSQRPVVTVLGTGDELRSPGEPGRASSVVESNGFFVTAGEACRLRAARRIRARRRQPHRPPSRPPSRLRAGHHRQRERRTDVVRPRSRPPA
jgi:molybdopterin molybdotransferase